METVPVLLMLPPAGETRAEAWVAQARTAAALDLLERIQRTPGAGPVFALVANPDDRSRLAARGVKVIPSEAGDFHFGRVIASIIRRKEWSRLGYFGGASAPLAIEALLHEAFEGAGPGRAVVNNYHSTDWAIVGNAAALASVAERLPSDNPLGWVLHHEAGLDVRDLPPRAATRADIDTPTDVAMLRGHPDAGPAMRSFLERLPPELGSKLDRLQRVIETPANTLAIIGRLSSGVWQALESRRQIWVRVFAEERGMLASGRLARGEVRSLIGSLVDRIGPAAFLRDLASMADGVIWDTRVWMAQRGPWPSASDRFSADLGWAEDIGDPALRALAEAVEAAQLPILTGGHGVVAGGLLAFLETIEKGERRPGPEGAYQPSR